MHLAFTLGASLIIFVAGIDATGDDTKCQVIAMVLHWFLLAAFAWMLVEGYHLNRVSVSSRARLSRDFPLIECSL